MKHVPMLLLWAVCLGAQQAPQAPKPGPEHKRLAYFAGNWTSEGDMKPSPWGPGGKFTTTDRGEVFPGGFFVVLHSSGKTPMGPLHELAVMGYNAGQKKYTYDSFTNMGEHESSLGTLEGRTWTWTTEEKVQGKTIRGRLIINEVSPTSYTFSFDMAGEGSAWTNIMQGKATRTK